MAPRRSAYAVAPTSRTRTWPTGGGQLVDAGVDVEGADQAEVDVQEPLARELHEQVLAGRVGADEQGAVERGGVGLEPALRAADPDA